MKILFYSILTSCLLFLCMDLSAQQKVIRGSVTDSETNERIIGATITEYDQDRRIITGTISDPNGNYVLSVKNPDGIFMVSFIGYKTYEFRIEGREVINIKLVPESIQMEEVVVTTVAKTDPLTGVSERDITSSRVRIDMAESKHIGTISAEEALQGQISGLDIMSVSGNPGSGSQIVIRGLGSLGSSTPLIVVDDIPQDLRIDASFDFGSADQEDIGDLVNISPQDIRSIEVLKDAASTAVWGSKGADGVLLIRTYRGNRGRTRFEYQGKFTLTVQPPAIPMLNGDEYIMMQLEELHNERGIFDIPSELAYDRDYADFYNYSANTDWVAAITRNGFINDQYFKLSGGGDKTRYFASVNYHDNTGTTINTSLKRISTRINLDYDVSTKMRFSVNFNYTNSYKEDNYTLDKDEDEDENIRRMAYIKAPNMSIWEYDENGTLTGEYFTPINSYQGYGDDYYNPVAIGNLSINDKGQNQVQNSFVMNVNMLTWLRFQQTISFQYLNEKRKQFLPIDAIGVDWPTNTLINRATEINISNKKILSRSQLFFIPRFRSEHHSFSGIMMMEIESGNADWANLYSSLGPSVQIKDPAANAQIYYLGSGLSETRGIGILNSLNYKLKDRYIISLNARIDGSSRFGRSQRWGLFPSISLGWRFSSEDWFSDIPGFSNGKIRISYGQTGKQPTSIYDRHAIFNTTNPNSYIENPIIVPLQVQLDNLKWQTVISWNLGLDLGFFEDRFTVTTDFYRKVTEDLLWEDYSIPYSSGYPELLWYNGGMLENKGWELFARMDVIRREELGLSLTFNISNNRNAFLEFPDNFNNEVATDIGNGQYPRRANIGQPVGSFYGFRYLGVWPGDEDVVALNSEGERLLDVSGNPVPLSYKGTYEFAGGDAKYQDINYDGQIDLMDVVYLGDSNPRFTGGFGTIFTWRQFKLNSHFHYRTGFQIVNAVAISTEGMLGKNNQSKAVLHRWRVQGQDEPGMLPRAYMNHPANNLGSDRYVEDGDFLRLVNLSLQYSLNSELCHRLRLESLDIALTMRRILTLTRYTGQDPEISQTGDDPFWFGTDEARTPAPKVFTLSIAAGF